MSLVLTSVLYGFLCCPSFNVTWSHFRYAWVSMLSEFACHLVSLPFCMILYLVIFSMSLSLTSVLYGSLFLSAFLCHLVSLSVCMGLYIVLVSILL